MKIRFLHTGDWHLGMTRHFFSEGVQERFSQSRYDSIGELGRIAKDKECSFMVVCGDVFESNQVDPKTVRRALEALKDIPVPVYLLPGNHDPLDAASVYNSAVFNEIKPDNVHVIKDSNPIQVDQDVEIVGVPWTSKSPMQDLVARAMEKLGPTSDTLRICVAHGGILDSNSPNRDDPALICLDAAEANIEYNKIHYLALGDRHSYTEVGDSGRIWYSGAPEPTDYREKEPGYALVATVSRTEIETEQVRVRRWRFIERKQVDLNTEEDIDSLEVWLTNMEEKARTVVKLRLVGSLSLLCHSKLEGVLERGKDVLGALELRKENLMVIPEDTDFEDMGFSGYVESTIDRLRSCHNDSNTDSSFYSDALALLVRLAGGGK